MTAEDRNQHIAALPIESIDEKSAFHEAGLEVIAIRMSLSTRQLSRIFQKQFGLFLHELIITRRLLIAKQLLIDTNLFRSR